jgi:hypothetical protein
MPGIEHALKSFDFGHLRIIAELWGIDFNANNTKAAVSLLSTTLLNPDIVDEIYDSLPDDAQNALAEIKRQNGKLTWPLFEKRFGTLREVGSALRDRKKIYLAPISPAEVLWYRGFVARDFFDTVSGPQEFAYIPQDLLSLLPIKSTLPNFSLGRFSLPEEYQGIIPANDSILDHACSLLACIRNKLSIKEIQSIQAEWPGDHQSRTAPQLIQLPIAVLQALLCEAGILGAENQPDANATRDFLAAPRNQALTMLVQSWLHADGFNELYLLPGIIPEGDWKNEPLQTREKVIHMLSLLPHNTWWSLPSFIESVKQNNPDFQRPSGDYDSWFIQDAHSGEFLRGFENWDAVEGALLSFFITGMLHWLGIIDLARAYPESPITSFRIREDTAVMLKGEFPTGLPLEKESIYIQSNAEIHIPRLAPRSSRYLVARFCEWSYEKNQVYFYRFTPRSLEQARHQELTIEQLLTLLKKVSQKIPPSLVKALKRWEKDGSAARVESVVLLRMRSAEVLQKVRNSRAARFLGDPVSPTTVILKPGSQQKVIDILAELGYLGEILD